MSGQTITRADLSEAVYQQVGLSRNESAALVETVLDEICDALAQGESVKISSFGSFAVRQKGERIGRNPKTGEEVPILPRRVMTFKSSNPTRSFMMMRPNMNCILDPRQVALPTATATFEFLMKTPVSISMNPIRRRLTATATFACRRRDWRRSSPL